MTNKAKQGVLQNTPSDRFEGIQAQVAVQTSYGSTRSKHFGPWFKRKLHISCTCFGYVRRPTLSRPKIYVCMIGGKRGIMWLWLSLHCISKIAHMNRVRTWCCSKRTENFMLLHINSLDSLDDIHLYSRSHLNELFEIVKKNHTNVAVSA